MQLVAQGCQEYGQYYVNFASTFAQVPSIAEFAEEAPIALDDLDADDLLVQTMTDRQRLAELGKLIGVARYALEGQRVGRVDAVPELAADMVVDSHVRLVQQGEPGRAGSELLGDWASSEVPGGAIVLRRAEQENAA